MNWSLEDPYNLEVGLWTQNSPGHTQPIAHLPTAHSGPNGASRLIVAFQAGVEADFPVDRVIKALSGLQVRDGTSMHGCCRWYAEEQHPVDTNASFFIGLNFLVLNGVYRDRLTSWQQAEVDTMLVAFTRWFESDIFHGKVHYPNKYLGDLVCLWLLREQLALPTKDLKEVSARAIDYYKESHWGWGEHLSDPYSTVMLDELSCLLLLSKVLPNDLRSGFLDLFKDLLRIEDLMDGGPRVPTIRSYAMRVQNKHRNYRQKIRLLGIEKPLHNVTQIPHLHLFPFGHTLHELGWHELASKPSKAPEFFSIPCYGGAESYTLRKGLNRLGSLSKYPIMPNTDQPQWGLSWQTKPIAFSRESGEWGFWRWGTFEGGKARYHPAKDKRSAYLSNALTDVISPPIAGETFSTADGSTIVALRQMPRVSNAWEWCEDGFYLSGYTGEPVQIATLDNGWHQLVLSWLGEDSLTIFCHTLESAAKPMLTELEGAFEWKLTWPSAEIAEMNPSESTLDPSPRKCNPLHTIDQQAGSMESISAFHTRRRGMESLSNREELSNFN